MRIYHNPRCSKSRATLELLRAGGVEPDVIEYLKNPPDAKALRELIAKLGARPRDIVRVNESVFGEKYAELDLEDDEAVLAALAAEPILLERPIVVADERAVIGRPPENVQALL